MTENEVADYTAVYGVNDVFTIDVSSLGTSSDFSAVGAVAMWSYRILRVDGTTWFSGFHHHSLASQREMNTKELVGRIAHDLGATRVYHATVDTFDAVIQAWYAGREQSPKDEADVDVEHEHLRNTIRYDVWNYKILTNSGMYDQKRVRRFVWPESMNAHKKTQNMIPIIAAHVAAVTD